MSDPRRLSRPQKDPFKIEVKGLRIPFHEDLYYRVLTTSWSAFFALAAGAFFFANSVFAGLYLLQPGAIAGARPGSFADAFFFSVQTMGTIGYGVLSPTTPYAQTIVTFEALTGLLGIAIVTGLTFSKFSRPSARIIFTHRFVLGTRDGRKCVMFGMANARHNTIVEASLRVVVLLDHVTAEGERIRVPFDLPLIRSNNPFFRLSWTAAHSVDEASPFYGEDFLERLRAKDALILASLSGLDETIGQTVHARHVFSLGDLVVGARFADILTLLPDGTRIIDYGKFQDVRLEDAAAAE